jgi:hypothetical protein
MPPLARNMQGCVCLCIDQDLTPGAGPTCIASLHIGGYRVMTAASDRRARD